MRVFVSSSFQDLQEFRLPAIRVLRQLGHEVIAMEDFVAASEVPLKKMLEKVERCDLYVGLFAWRYGFIPKKTGKGGEDPKVPEAKFGETSITHYEYLHAKAKGIDRLAFLLDEQTPWPPHLIDGFSTLDKTAPKDASAIRALRAELQLGSVVSYFSNPSDLEARVGAAVTVAGVGKHVSTNLERLGQAMDTVNDSAPEQGIRTTIGNAGQVHALKIDLASNWWSTRLYLTASLAERLTRVKRLVITKGEDFIGLLSTQWIVSTLAAKHPILATFGRKLQRRRQVLPDINAEMTAVFELWTQSFGGEGNSRDKESATKVELTADLLGQWFGDAMLQQPVSVTDLKRTTVVELLRILDYPSDFVPVVLRRKGANYPDPEDQDESSDPIQVVDKSALTARLAQDYVEELMDRARIA